MHSWPLLLPTFALLSYQLSVSLFFSILCFFLLTHFGETHMRENLFPPIFWHKKKISAKKIRKNGNLNFLPKKADFCVFFLLFTASVRSWRPEPPLVPGVLAITTLTVVVTYPFFFQHAQCVLLFQWTPRQLAHPVVTSID